ncbi:MAG: fascin domain-containing protein [Peptostreptococcaceae bacterium]
MKTTNNENKRNPKGGLIVFPPFGSGQIPPNPWLPPEYNPNPGGGLGPGIPPLPSEEDEEKLKVKIKSDIENEFVVVDNDGYLYATGDKVNKNGIFKLILDENKVKIRQVEGDFVRVDERDFLVADTNKKNATVFKLYKVDKGQYVLKAPNGYFVRVRDKDKALVARAENAGKRTIFKFKIVD